MFIPRILSPVLLAVPLIVTARADYTYIDATLENTTLAGAAFTLGPPANYENGTTSTGGDGLWSFRTVTGYEGGGTLFESDPGTPPLVGGQNDYENTPDLVTTVTLPVAGTYRIVAVFDINSKRDIAARLGASPGTADIFTTANAIKANQGVTTPAIVFDASYTNARGANAGAANLGTVITTIANEVVAIHVNGLASTTTLDIDGRHDDERTRYDGIGYEFIAPPPGPAHRDVFIIAGQSNADGRGLNSELTGPLASFTSPQSGVLIHYSNPAYGDAGDPLYQTWTTLRPGFSIAPGSSGALPRGTFGMEIGAGSILSQHYPNPAFIKVTRGGTSLASVGNDWYPPLPSPTSVGPLYTELITSTQLALQQLTATGDTYTVHALFWHQGESDGNRESQYAGVFANFVSAFRRDLGLPNLRVIVGELGPGKPQSFRDIQWNNSRNIRNAGFVSSKNLTTSDEVTHFDTASAIRYGERLGKLMVGHGRVIGFEAPAFTVSGLDRQNDFSADAGVLIVPTNPDGEYSGGQAAANTTPASGTSAHLQGVLPLASARGMQADFHPAQTDSALSVAGWAQDTNADGRFDPSETGIGMGLGADGLFFIRVGGTVFPATGFNYQADHWYRLTASWTVPDAGGLRTITLHARDLSGSLDLNGGSPVVVASIAAADPGRWLGLGLEVNHGKVDNIGVEGPGFSGWMENRHPSLTGGPTGDHDGDGILNGFEYAYGLDPTLADPPTSVPRPVLDSGNLILSIPEIARAEGVLVQVDASTDLTSWSESAGQRSAASIDHVFPTAGVPQRFLRTRLAISE